MIDPYKLAANLLLCVGIMAGIVLCTWKPTLSEDELLLKPPAPPIWAADGLEKGTWTCMGDGCVGILTGSNDIVIGVGASR